MRRSIFSDQAVRLICEPSRSHFVCRACRAAQSQHRPLHTSPRRQAELPFWKRMQEGLFGSKKSKQVAEKREAATQKEIESVAEQAERRITITKRGREYEVAALVNPAINKDYVQASNATGLETIGSQHWIRARRDQGEQYVGFLPKGKKEFTDVQWQRLLHHIFVEIVALKTAGRDVDEVCNHRLAESQSWQQTGSASIDFTSGEPSVSFATPEDVQRVLNAIPTKWSGPQEGVEASEARLVADHTESTATQTLDWMKAPFADLSIKLALVKRTLQLTGRRISDPSVASASNLGDIYHAFKARTAPKKLAQTTQLGSLNSNLPNVKVYARRRTPIHKEKDIGRWKVIEEELLRRDLPVTGSRWQNAKSTL